MSELISREIALRVGLAARELEDTDAARLLLSPGSDGLESRPEAAPDKPVEKDVGAEAGVKEAKLMEKINAAMGERKLYQQSGFTIAQLGQELAASEQRLRTTINSTMGFRNFNQFLNHYRIDEASRLLVETDEPIASIAMDHVVPGAAVDHVVAQPGLHAVIAPAGEDHVVVGTVGGVVLIHAVAVRIAQISGADAVGAVRALDDMIRNARHRWNPCALQRRNAGKLCRWHADQADAFSAGECQNGIAAAIIRHVHVCGRD